MAEFIVNGAGTVQPGKAIPLITSIACPKGYIVHREGSGIITLRGIVNNPCANFARYLVMYSGNIAVPTGETVGEIGLGLSIAGEIVNGTVSVSTPGDVNEYNSVASSRYITVPKGCCYTLSLDDNADIPVAYDENTSVIITRVA